MNLLEVIRENTKLGYTTIFDNGVYNQMSIVIQIESYEWTSILPLDDDHMNEERIVQCINYGREKVEEMKKYCQCSSPIVIDHEKEIWICKGCLKRIHTSKRASIRASGVINTSGGTIYLEVSGKDKIEALRPREPGAGEHNPNNPQLDALRHNPDDKGDKNGIGTWRGLVG